MKNINNALSTKNADAEKKLAEAKKNAEILVKNALNEAKKLAVSETREFEKLQHEKNLELERLEKRIQKREESLEKRGQNFEQKEQELAQKMKILEREEEALRKTLKEAQDNLAQSQRDLEIVANLSIEDARDELKKLVEQDVQKSIARDLRMIEEETRKTADEKARGVLATSIQRLANEFVADSCVSVITLPNDDMKGRIIGREGRNIRAIEQATGVDLIIDDTPEAILISCFNPIRREIAKVSIERLIADGRIHPSRIDEIVQKVTGEFDQIIQEAGEKSSFDCGITGLHGDLITALGKLKFLTTGGQSVLQHSIETAQIAGIMAAELGIDARLAKRAGLFHDIGKSLSEETEGNHSQVGAEFLEKYGEPKEVIEAAFKHHQDMTHGLNLITILVQAANNLSNFRPGAKREFLEKSIARLEDMENVVESFKEVEQAFVMRSGKEVRVMVSPKVFDDKAVTILAKSVAKTLRKDFNQPGNQIKITMIREQRATDIAR